jgi:tetratricopeptide (TPR) repeat protein
MAELPSIEQAFRLHQAGQLGPASALYQQILAVRPDDFDALQLFGALCMDQGDPAAAAALLERALARQDDATVRLNLGRAWRALGRLDAAERQFRQAAATAPAMPEAHLFLGNLLRETRRLEAAAESYRTAGALRPDHAETLLLLGQTLHQLGRLDEAQAHYAVVLALVPGQVQARLLLADCLAASGRLDAAVETYRQVVAAAPGLAPAQCNLGVALQRQGRPDEALACFGRAVAAVPGFVEAWYNQGVVLRDLGRDAEAEASFRRAVELAPDHADARSDLGLVELRRGAWEAGWRDYEWRWRARRFSDRLDPREQPQWRGETEIRGRRLRLRAEQGLGDTLQFCRYAPLAQGLGAEIELAVQPGLVPLLAGQFDGIAVVDQRAAPSPADLHCPLMSLPLALGLAGPEAGAPYLAADPARRAAWPARVRADGALRVGLVWAGNPAHGNDRNRSIPVAAFGALCAIPGLRCYAVQKQVSDEERGWLAASGVDAFGDGLTDFAETAALLAELDLVISVDTAVAHLAGALGRPVWILLPAVADWRWGVGRTDTPWYPTARLFRQGGAGWAPVLQEVAAAAARLAVARG